MSGKNSRNSRKEKLVVREGLNLDEAINIELQNIAQTSSKLDKMDEDISNTEDSQTIIDIANIKKEINESSYVENPNMKFTIRVEVEEYNEDVKHKIKIEMHDIQDYVQQDQPAPSNQRVILKERKKNRIKRLKQPLKSVMINLNDMYAEVDRIVRTSNNIADEILARELRNNWGSVLRRPLNSDPINSRLQEVIQKWKSWTSSSKYRDVPVFYKCYICQTAWWYLYPFRDHLKTHQINTFRVELEENLHESNIIAYGTKNIPQIKYLKAEGDCWRCNKPFEQHISTKKHNSAYHCKYCDDRFYSCANLKAHEAVCWQYFKHIEVERDRAMIMCHLCQCMFVTDEELSTHMISYHSVRSDQPIQSHYKICSACDHGYFVHALHGCNKKQMSNNCEKCLRGFATKLTLTIHTLLTDKDVQCQICPETLDMQCVQILHYQSHTNMFKVAFKCCACSNLEVFLDENSFRKHRLFEHRLKNDKRRYHCERVLLPITYFGEEEIEAKRRAANTVVGQKDYADFPVFAAKDVKKTYQAKTKVYPEQELQEALTAIKREMVDYDQSQDGYEAMTQNLESEGTSGQVSEGLIPPAAIKTEIKSEPIDEEYDAIIVTLDDPEQNIKEEPIEEITIEPETIYKVTQDMTQPETMYKDTEDVIEPETMCIDTEDMTEPETCIDVQRKQNKELNSKYPCSRCYKNFHSARKYLLHFVEHRVPYMSCPVCLTSFETMTKLAPHVAHHMKQTYVKLKVIDETSKAKAKRRGNKEGKYLCKVCRSIVESDNLYGHWDTHCKTGWRKHVDEDVCNTALRSEGLQMVIDHLLQNTKRKMKRDCVICLRHFERNNDCKRHLIEHLLADAFCNRPIYGGLRCQVCQETFQRPDKYKLHMRDHGSLPVYRCDICDRAFSDSSNFTKHKKVHNLQVVVCDVCKKKFQTKLSLVKHLEMHSTTKPITCQLCLRVSHTESAYRKHIRRFHDRTVIKFKCHLCAKKFDSVRDKWDHLWLVHKERKREANCPVCKKEFRKYQDVRMHMMFDHAIVKKKKKMKKDDIERFLKNNPPLEAPVVLE